MIWVATRYRYFLFLHNQEQAVLKRYSGGPSPRRPSDRGPQVAL